ncbi:MAG: preprotein translocase subunit YajC [Lutibacter sp.]|uniref:preprotein translocase subunit YajC n=1 Tax=Lutibacter sp. TaxID=1925666 RepID=UPI0017F38FB0|nr:preprotein translocase subunit YajC [Lutibacter sp.]MBT8317041.1 preprotein translocase subunit YajC [Lutibacter sp.]NNJ57901.1 preprotein translocase subunit YajC [Lutibacter sp.]
MYSTIFLQFDGGALSGMLPFLLMFLVIYLFMIRPQMKRQKNEKLFQASIAKGNKVITTSGIHGKILDIVDSDNTVILETGAGKIKFERSAISMEMSKKLQAPKVVK